MSSSKHDEYDINEPQLNHLSIWHILRHGQVPKLLAVNKHGIVGLPHVFLFDIARSAFMVAILDVVIQLAKSTKAISVRYQTNLCYSILLFLSTFVEQVLLPRFHS